MEKQSQNTQEEKKALLPSINLPKGGGAINGIGEKFSVNALTGTGSASIPVPVSPGRNGFAPQLVLAYDSGAGNSAFGLGWNLSLPSIQRKTSKGLPQYNDAEGSDTFLLSGAEDLVPTLYEKTPGNWVPKTKPEGDHIIYYYRPRTEGLFALIEKWVHNESKEIHWKTTSKENVTSFYGRSKSSKIYDSQNPHNVFEWLLEESRDNHGNIIVYNYKQENEEGIDASKPSEQNRLKNKTAFNHKYIKNIQYGNKQANVAGDWFFQVVFDYGEHSAEVPTLIEEKKWSVRQDAFSNFTAGFEIRNYRLCSRILIFHQFEELGALPVLVKSTDLTYKASPHLTQLIKVRQTGYIKNGNAYVSKSTPPVEYIYSEAVIGNTIQTISSQNLENLPIGVDGMQYYWVDLEGEGIEGILTEQGGAWFYKSNLGDGNFSSTKVISSQPSLIGNGRPQLQDMDGNGEKELTIFTNQTSGFYNYTDGNWQNYQAFEQMPNLNWQDPNLKFLDLNGDGFADILITEEDVLRWFPSKVKQGYEASKTVFKTRDEEEGPALIFADADQSIYLADMSGDGLTDILRIRNKAICYWPNLGYGKFGAKIVMDNAPVMDSPEQFHQKNIRLTDVDGSGTTDIIYLSNQGVKIWFNHAGNSWSDETVMPVFPATNNITDVQVADLLGKGTPCLVWSSPLPNDNGSQLRYVDLMTEGKPYLLNKVINNMGAESRIHYAPSTKFYLEDKKNGKPWITKLHFPVYVVAKTETLDLISNSKLAVTYKYHHGYYDGEEREFRGFGMVEQLDEEVFDENSLNAEENIHFVPPIHTKTWFHTGAYVKGGIISTQYKKEYYSEDTEAYALPDTVIENAENFTYTAKREACRALRGQVLRTEVYALDKTDKEIHPYSVSEMNFAVRQLQAHHQNKFAVYLVHPNESISFAYERDHKDPRISHSITVDVDNYGIATQSAQVVYPRRDGQPNTYPEQQQLHMVLQETAVIHKAGEGDYYVLGIPVEQKAFEVTGIVPNQVYFIAEELRKKLAAVQEINYSDTVNLQKSQKRVLSWSKSFFWNANQTEALGFKEITWPVLPHHGETTVFTEALIEEVYKGDLTLNDLEEKGKYLLKDGYWWAPSPVQFFYGAAQFHLPYKTMDAWSVTSEIGYDHYYFIPTSSIDALDNKTVATIDYRTLSPEKVIDVQGNTTAAITDALGMVIATTAYGREEVEDENGTIRVVDKGDAKMEDYVVRFPETLNPLEAIVSQPGLYLQNAATYFYYDMEAFYTRQQPPQFIGLTRQIHVSELQQNETSLIHIALGYSDGFGRSLQQKIKVESGLAYISDNKGGLVVDSLTHLPKKENTEDRWLSSGRTVYNNKQKPYKQYEPFYISGYAYEKENDLTRIGLTPVIHYDPLMRVVKTDTPKGFFSKVEFTSWEIKTYDLNDTVKDSAFWEINKNNPEEKVALEKAKAHFNTPALTILDSLGRAFINVGVKTDIDTPGTRQFITYTTFNINGKPLTQTDPRQYELNKTRDKALHNFVYTYDMAGNVIHTNSIDAGESRVFANSIGNPLYTWTNRGFKNWIEYDAVHRPVATWCQGGDEQGVLNEATLLEKMIYGTKDSGLNKNLQVLQHYDQTGLVQLERVSFKGEALKTFKQFCKKYQAVVNWYKTEDSVLLEEKFNSSSSYDALGRLIESRAPDGSISKPVFNFSGQLKKVQLKQTSDANFKDYVVDIQYNEKGQRESIQYGNNTLTKYVYDEKNYALKNLRTTRTYLKKQAPGNTNEPPSLVTETVQDLYYRYDPVGNITEVSDTSQKTVFYNNEQVDAVNTYTYDAFYQLLNASGREHSGQNNLYSQFNEFLPAPPHTNDAQAMRNYTQQFDYDDAGNKLYVIHKADSNNWNRYFTYDELSNRLQKTEVSQLTELYDYDANGNMQNLSSLTKIQWNYKNELAYIEKGTTKAWYNYDSSGQRCRKVVQEGTKTKVRYYIGGYEVYREYFGNELTNTPESERQSLHISDDNRRIALIETKTIEGTIELNAAEGLIRYQYSNHLDSASLELDHSAQLISYEEYYPYGNTSYQAVDSTREVPAKRYRYTGMERDEESGLNYHTARYYAPWLGRWLCPDPAGTVDGLNVYLYCRGNPIIFLDASGEASFRITEISTLAGDSKRTHLQIERGAKESAEEVKSSLREYLNKLGQSTGLDFNLTDENWAYINSEIDLGYSGLIDVEDISQFDNLIGRFLVKKYEEDKSWKTRGTDTFSCSPTIHDRVTIALREIFGEDSEEYIKYTSKLGFAMTNADLSPQVFDKGSHKSFYDLNKPIYDKENVITRELGNLTLVGALVYAGIIDGEPLTKLKYLEDYEKIKPGALTGLGEHTTIFIGIKYKKDGTPNYVELWDQHGETRISFDKSKDRYILRKRTQYKKDGKWQENHWWVNFNKAGNFR